ncbi:MAG: SUMF1/EgtB/PvdO family nonheme iron enzyme [Deltaproteobacteria bacterium]|nr:SUMF1/EgtB/PvdO family nonheme iron enzyme [Deltaproteobacteria bacterium]
MKRSTRRKILFAAFVVAVAALSGGAWIMFRASGEGEGDPGMGALGTKRKPEPRHNWRSVRGRHWQIISTEFEEADVTDAREGNRGSCSAGMVEVKGKMKLEPDHNPFAEGRIEKMQLKTCTDWISKDYPERCQQFDQKAWLAASEGLETKEMQFCMDRFEYPNIKGQYPLIYVSWYEAVELCKGKGKRLCAEDEWTFACEGEEAKPYPYGDGYRRDPTQCVTDQRWLAYNEKAMVPRDGAAAGLEMDRLWHGKPSGGQGQCRSDLGVYDLTGNIDEWTRTVREGERPSILKGGYWGPVRTRCRPSTRSHDENHMFYQQGFRCCNAAGQPPKRQEAGGPDMGPRPHALD